MTLFWYVAPCSLEEIDRHFRGAYCLHHQGELLMMEAVSTSETSVNFYETTLPNIPEDRYLHTRRRKNPKYHKVFYIFNADINIFS
jgi:hypothetical protein